MIHLVHTELTATDELAVVFFLYICIYIKKNIQIKTRKKKHENAHTMLLYLYGVITVGI